MFLRKEPCTQLLHYNMAMLGGFLGGYAVLTRSYLLGNAQTANLIDLVLSLLGRNLYDVALRIIALLCYVSGAMLFVLVQKKTNRNPKRIALCIDLAAVIALGFLPADLHPVIGLYPIFFAMSFQWNAFPGAYGYTSSTIFSTNNIRQVSLGLAEYFCTGERTALHKAAFFSGTLCSFHLGVAASFFTVHLFAVRGVWCGLILFPAAYLLTRQEEINLRANQPVPLPRQSASARSAS